jgi:ribosomal protein S18 acetylase RimI-like enzyme
MVRAICDMHARMDPDRYGFLPDVVDRYERWLPQRAADPRSVFLVAEADPAPDLTDAPAAIVGFLVASVEKNIPIYTLSEFGFIHDVWVDPAHRARGHASSLVDDALARFRAMGITQVRLETAAANDSARRLFASRGFRTGTIDMLRTL